MDESVENTLGRLGAPRKQWQRALKAIGEVQIADKQAYVNVFERLNVVSNEYARKLINELRRNKNETAKDALLLEARLVEASRALAESFLGVHLEQQYGIAPLLVRWIGSTDKALFDAWTKQIEDLDYKTISILPKPIDMLASVVGMGNKHRDIRRGAKRGEMLAQRAAVVEDMAMRAYIALIADVETRKGGLDSPDETPSWRT